MNRSGTAYLRVDDCPRCLARDKALMPLVLSANRVEPAIGWGRSIRLLRVAVPRRDIPADPATAF